MYIQRWAKQLQYIIIYHSLPLQKAQSDLHMALMYSLIYAADIVRLANRTALCASPVVE